MVLAQICKCSGESKFAMTHAPYGSFLVMLMLERHPRSVDNT
jgi:hypothetical protein